MRLANDHLAVEIDAPGSRYRGSRFDWTGVVRHLTVAGHELLAAEQPGPADGRCSNGAGLCAEFAGALGYEEAAPGEAFVKPGVGLLVRRPGPYSFMDDLPTTPFPTAVEADGDGVRSIQEPLPCRGWAFAIERRIRLEGAALVIDTRVDNRGERVLPLREYRHNFLGFAGRPLGPDHCLVLPFPLAGRLAPPGARVLGDTVTWPAPAPLTSLGCDLPADLGARRWTLHDRATGISLHETTDRPWSRLYLYGVPGQLSIEAFLAIDLAPGECASWRRTYAIEAATG